MKKAILLLSLAIIANTLWGVNEKYIKKMGETISQFTSCTTVQDFQDLANKFSVIANVENTEWLPLYYEAYCYIIMSFTDRSDAENRDGYLDQASNSIEKMLDLVPNESEVYALKAFYHTGRLVINPAERSQTESPLVDSSVAKALTLDQDNPRAAYIRITNEIGRARFFGSDTTPFCKSANELLQEWDSYKIKSGIYPGWGKNLVEEIVNHCGE